MSLYAFDLFVKTMLVDRPEGSGSKPKVSRGTYNCAGTFQNEPHLFSLDK